MNRTSKCTVGLAMAILAVGGSVATAAIVPPTGYIYSPLALGTTTVSCIAVGPGGTFVGVGHGFAANASAVVFLKESGEARLVAFGFNSIGDCVYNAATDKLYVTDNADNADLEITTGMSGNTGAQTGDTVFAVANASTASARVATDLELLPPNSVEFASSLALDASGNVFVSDAVGGSMGTVLKISPGPISATFKSGFQFTGGLAINPANGHVFVAESLPSFQNQLHEFTAAGSTVASPLLGPSNSFGSYDLAFANDGRLLVSGLFFGDVVAIDLSGPTVSPFISGFTFANGIAVNDFTGRVEVLSSFSGSAEDNTVHRFIPIDQLVPGGTSGDTECLHEFYGLELVAEQPGDKAKKAICVDGAACDADGKVNDRCVFPVGSCVNVTDPRLTECMPSAAITTVTTTAGKDVRAFDSFNDAIHASLPVLGPACFFSDGVVVPVKVKASGKKPGKGKVAVTVESEAGQKDRDIVSLVCQPAS